MLLGMKFLVEYAAGDDRQKHQRAGVVVAAEFGEAIFRGFDHESVGLPG